MLQLSIVIPVYKSPDSLKPLFEGIAAALEPQEIDFEVIFVEDGGGDNSWDVVRELAAQHKQIRGLKLTRNFGQHHAALAGLNAAKGDWIITMDCDMQDDPAFIPSLLEAARAGSDIVLVRRVGRNDGFFKQLFGRLFYLVFDALTGFRSDPDVGWYRVMSRRVVDTYLAMPERHRFFNGMIQWMGFPTTHVEFPRRERHSGKSGYTFIKTLRLATDAILSFSDRPLKLMVFIGGLTSIAAAVYVIVVVIQRFVGVITEVGYASLIASIYLIGGLLLACVGVVGMYVGRISSEIKGRPIYLVVEDTDHDHVNPTEY